MNTIEKVQMATDLTKTEGAAAIEGAAILARIVALAPALEPQAKVLIQRLTAAIQANDVQLIASARKELGALTESATFAVLANRARAGA